MSVYIPGMEMPETCKLCYLSDFDAGYYAFVCKPTGIRIDYEMGRISKPHRICPLVPVPNHGRLIDADALLNFLNRCMFPSDMVTTTAVSMAVNWVKDAPTIIPADKEGGT